MKKVDSLIKDCDMDLDYVVVKYQKTLLVTAE